MSSLTLEQRVDRLEQHFIDFLKDSAKQDRDDARKLDGLRSEIDALSRIVREMEYWKKTITRGNGSTADRAAEMMASVTTNLQGFSTSDLYVLASDLGSENVDPDDLEKFDKRVAVRKLVNQVRKSGLFWRMVQNARDMYPNMNWPEKETGLLGRYGI